MTISPEDLKPEDRAALGACILTVQDCIRNSGHNGHPYPLTPRELVEDIVEKTGELTDLLDFKPWLAEEGARVALLPRSSSCQNDHHDWWSDGPLTDLCLRCGESRA